MLYILVQAKLEHVLFRAQQNAEPFEGEQSWSLGLYLYK
jgi:hypothetical protein